MAHLKLFLAAKKKFKIDTPLNFFNPLILIQCKKIKIDPPAMIFFKPLKKNVFEPPSPQIFSLNRPTGPIRHRNLETEAAQ